MSKIEIKIDGNAQIEGYEGAFCAKMDENGKATIDGLWNNWFSARAFDAEGNQYEIIWALCDDYDPDVDCDDGDACDWDTPYQVLSIDDGERNVTDRVEIVSCFSRSNQEAE